MIIDSANKLTEYIDINPLLGVVAEYLNSNDLTMMPDGRYHIEGDRAYMDVGDYALRDEACARAEAHNRYMDIQIVIQGKETYGWADRARCYDVLETDEQADLVFFGDFPTKFFVVDSGEMAVFLPSDVHMPCLGQGPGNVRKAIVKVAVEQ